MEKQINTRFLQKHDLEENWLKAQNFVPKAGELIVYDVDESHLYPRIKIGDGEKVVNDLPFASLQSNWGQNDASQADFVQGRTHWAEYIDKIEFDGNYGDETMPLNGRNLIRVSNDFIPYDNLFGSYISNIVSEGIKVEFSIQISDEWIIAPLQGWDVGIEQFYAVVTNELPFFYGLGQDFIVGGRLIRKGLFIDEEVASLLTFTWLANPDNPPIKSIQKIPDKFLPDAPVVKTTKSVSCTAADLMNSGTTGGITFPLGDVEAQNIEICKEIKIEKDGLEVLLTDVFSYEGLFVFGNPALISSKWPEHPVMDFAIYLQMFAYEGNLILFPIRAEGNYTPLADATFTFYYNAYKPSNICMLPAPLVIDFDFKDDLKQLSWAYREKIKKNLQVGRQVYAKYQGEEVQIKAFDIDADEMGWFVLCSIDNLITYVRDNTGRYGTGAWRQIACMRGEGAPNESTEAPEIGALYVDTNTGEFYKCVRIEYGSIGPSAYVWEPLVAPQVQIITWGADD